MGIYLASPNKEKNSVDDIFGTMKYGASAMQGWRVNMEDAHLSRFNIAPKTHLFAVFDGHGGCEVAKYVERHFIEELLSCAAYKTGNYEKALNDTFLRMDVMLQTPEGKKELSQLKGGDDKSGYQTESFAGCTSNVVLIVDNEMYCANAGDSRCVLSHKGQAVEMSHDHKPDNDIEKERIQRAGGYISDGRINGNLNLSRAIGDLEYKKDEKIGVHEQLIVAVPEVKKRHLTADDDFFVIGCDGIWECMQNQDIVDFVAKKLKDKDKNLSKIVEELLDTILAGDTSTGIGCDNMTCMIVCLK
jgi:serine/threonine protein phosphatase PrpC